MMSKSIVFFQGPLQFGTIAMLLSEFKMAAHDHSLSYRAYKKMISIMIEALENVYRYTSLTYGDQDAPSGCTTSFQINLRDNGLELITRNPVRKEDMASLRNRIDHVNRHNRAELKQLYRDTITNGKFTMSGGAGLGFIEMAKASGSSLQYQFEDFSEECVLYTLKVGLNA